MSLEKIYTIEVNDVMEKNLECPFCCLEDSFEKNALDFTLGSSYMESDVREQTDASGFCRNHMEKMYHYGNALGNAWILKTRLIALRKKYKSYEESCKQQSANKEGLLSKIRTRSKGGGSGTDRIRYGEENCFICQRIRKYYNNMLESFLYLLINDPDFPKKIQDSKGFCMRHFPDLIQMCEEKLTRSQKEQYIPMLLEVMNRNLERIQEDIDWFIEKYDYRNEKESWKNSKDALPRTIGKINGINIAKEK